ncbi:MAG: dUTP diphosphatase [Propionibacteriaceae bacterium]|nr:dUTP diphosphatase [Propionibacteriaceae bacterium]
MAEHVISVRRLCDGAQLPSYAHEDDAGADLVVVEDLSLQPGQRAVVGTGLAVAIPVGYAGMVFPRSGLAARSGLTLVNSPGLIDAGYRGEIRLCLLNTDRHSPITLKRGDRVAQLVIQKVEHARFDEVDTLDSTDRGSGGYGSSGGVAGWQESSPTRQ